MTMDESTFGVCRIEVDELSYEVDFSDTTNALGDVLRAALIVATGGYEAGFDFEREPGTWRWRLGWKTYLEPWRRVFEVMVESVRYGLPDEITFRCECDPDQLVQAIADTGQRIWQELGPERYDSLWGQAFPLKILEALKTALTVVDPEKLPRETALTISVSSDGQITATDANGESIDIAALERGLRSNIVSFRPGRPTPDPDDT